MIAERHPVTRDLVRRLKGGGTGSVKKRKKKVSERSCRSSPTVDTSDDVRATFLGCLRAREPEDFEPETQERGW